MGLSMRKLIILILIFLLLISCSNKTNNKQKIIEKRSAKQVVSTPTKITEEQFINYYVEAAKLREKYADKSDSLSVKLEALRKKLDVTEKDIKEFRSIYSNAPKKWKSIWDKIQKRLNDYNL